MIRTIIVDDEPKAINSLKKLVGEFISEVDIVGECSSINEAYVTILKNKPDLVFLDVEIPPHTGFDLLEKFKTRDFEVIFITAYSEYAIKAIKESALDYIVKPIVIEELVDAVSKVKERRKNENDKLLLSDSDRLKPVDVEEIVRCESFKNYTTFYFSSEEKFTVSKPIGYFEGKLSGNRFVRVHNSHIINLDHVLHFDKVNDCIVMKNQANVPVSRRKKERLMSLLGVKT